MDVSDYDKRWMGLVETENGQLLFSPLSKSVKTKYTCIAVSSTHVVLGANTGSLYCFTAKGYKYVRLLANMEGPVSLARFSPNEKTLAVVVGSNTVCFWEVNFDEKDSKRFHVSTILKGGVVTEMVWDGDTRLFYGDNLGQVALAFIPKMSRKFGSSSFFKRGDEVIHNEKSPIVQLDIHKDTLLVSSYQRCCFLKLTNELQVSNVVKVGKKERDGPYGALFHPRVPGRPPVVYSTRPGGRMWEADVAGSVLSTIRLKDLVTLPPVNIISIGDPFMPATLPSTHQSVSMNFSHLLLMQNKFLIAWQKGSLFIFHPSSYSLLCWSNTLDSIVQVECVNEKVYVLYDDCQKISCLSFIDMATTLLSLMNFPNPSLTCEFMIKYSDVVKTELVSTDEGQSLLLSLVAFITDSGQKIPPELDEIMDLLPKEEPAENEESEEVDGVVALVVPETDSDPTVLDSTPTVPEETHDEVVTGSMEMPDDDGLFPMDSGVTPEVTKPEFFIPDELNSSEEGGRRVTTYQPPITNTQSLMTTPTLLSASPQTQSLPTAFTSPDPILPGPPPVEGSVHPPLIPLSPPTTSSIYPTTDRVPLSVRMAGGGGRPLKGEPDDEVSVVSRPKKKKKPSTKKRKSIVSSKSKSHQDLGDIFESCATSEVSPTHSRMSSTNPSKENSRASSPLRTESRNSISDTEGTVQLSSSIPNEDNGDTVDSIGHIPYRSHSLDAGTTSSLADLPPPQLPRRQSIDVESTTTSVDMSSRLGIQTPSVIISKVKSMASNQQEKTGRKVKELFSSLSSSQGPPTAMPSVYNTPLAAAVNGSPPDQVSIGVTSPSPEVGVLPTISDHEDHSNPISPESSPVPDIETERFVAFTTETMSSLNTPATLCSPEQFQQTLTRWRMELSTYSTHLSTSVSGDEELTNRGHVFLSASSPYAKLDRSVQNTVTELVTLAIQSSLTPEEVPEFIDNYVPLIDLRSVTDYLGRNLSVAQMKQCWSIFSRCDEHYFKNLRFVSHKDNIDKIKEFISSYSLTGPGLLQRVFESNPSKFLKLAFSLPDIQLWEVAMVTCCNVDDPQSLDTFGQYLNESFSKSSPMKKIKSKNLSYLESHEEMFLLSVKACLITSPTDDLFDEKQTPRPHSNMVEWPYQTALMSLTSSLLSSMPKKICEQVAQLFQEKGYWRGLLSILKHHRQSKEMFSLIADLRDQELLKEICHGSFLDSPSKWKAFLTCLMSQGIPFTATEPTYLTIESSVKVMVGLVGVEESCRVLDQVEQLQCNDFPSSLHQFLSDAATLDREKRTVAHLLLEMLDRHLWAARPSAPGPHLYAVYKSKNPAITESTDFTQLKSSSLSIHSSSTPTIHIQDTGTHWGAKTDYERCGVCGYLVTTKLSDRELASYAFNCGHFYHRECLPEQACVQCFVRRYSNEVNYNMKS